MAFRMKIFGFQQVQFPYVYCKNENSGCHRCLLDETNSSSSTSKNRVNLIQQNLYDLSKLKNSSLHRTGTGKGIKTCIDSSDPLLTRSTNTSWPTFVNKLVKAKGRGIFGFSDGPKTFIVSLVCTEHHVVPSWPGQ